MMILNILLLGSALLSVIETPYHNSESAAALFFIIGCVMVIKYLVEM